MKIQPVSHKNTTSKTRKNGFGKQDLSSFQQKSQVQQNSLTDKNASDAIKSNFLSNVSFQGHTESLTKERTSFIYGTSGAVHANLTDPKKEVNTHKIRLYNSYGGQESTNQELIKNSSRYYPNSSIENTSPHRTGYETERVYFADPEEEINNQTRRDHDYIVYDNRPFYPRLEEVKRNYFNCDDIKNRNHWNLEVATDYGQYYKTIADYYYRLESADKRHVGKLIKERNDFEPEYKLSLKYKEELDARTNEFPWENDTIKEEKEKADYFFHINNEKYEQLSKDIGYYNNRIEFAKTQQKKAIQAFKIFDEVGLMFFERDTKRKELRGIKDNIENKTNYIEQIKHELEELNTKKDEITEQLNAVITLKNINEKRLNKPEYERKNYSWREYELEEEDKKERELSKEILSDLSKKIDKLEDKLKKIEIKIKNLDEAKADAEKYIAENEKRIPRLGREIADKANEIKRYYYKMEEFYKNNIEEWQCK